MVISLVDSVTFLSMIKIRHLLAGPAPIILRSIQVRVRLSFKALMRILIQKAGCQRRLFLATYILLSRQNYFLSSRKLPFVRSLSFIFFIQSYYSSLAFAIVHLFISHL